MHGYAFQKSLEKYYGIKSVVIDYFPKAVEGDNLKYPILNNDSARKFPYWVAAKFNWTLGFLANIKRYNKFERFIKQYIEKTEVSFSYQQLKNTLTIEDGKFPIYVCESDVIWKVMSEETIDDNFFLNFPAAVGSRKVAYAPSLSTKELSGHLLERFKGLVKGVDAISAREKKGAEYLSRITGKEVPWVLDPTLLLNAMDYEALLKEPSEKNYLLVYTVTENDIRMVKEAVRYGKEHNLKVIEISNYAINRFIVNHHVEVGVGIEEWLGYFRNADVVVTNSFHGFCFSVIFKKDVYLFQRNNEDYKMQNIAESLGMKDRLIGFEDKKIPSHVEIIDWEMVDEKLDVMRTQSHQYIKENIIKYCN